TVGGGNTLNFELGAAAGSNDTITLGTGRLASLSGSNTLTLTLLARPATGNYTLITAPGGGFTAASGNGFTIGTAGAGSAYGTTFSFANTTTTALIVTATTAADPAAAYFQGSIDNNWNSGTAGVSSNFTTDSA